MRETFLCLHYCNDRQFIPSSFDENDVLICTKNDKNDERKYSYATAFLTAKSKQNDEYIFWKEIIVLSGNESYSLKIKHFHSFSLKYLSLFERIKWYSRYSIVVILEVFSNGNIRSTL